ncbi:MAG: TraB/GumN family protein [Chitinophagaceae bacterium]
MEQIKTQMTLQKFILGILTVMILIPGQSQPAKKKITKPSTQPKPALKTKKLNTLLWEISGNGLSQPSYLFGTMHVLCAEDAVLSTPLKSVIKKCIKVYFEIDMDDMTEMMGAMKYMRMNDGIKISDLLTLEEYARLEAYFKKSKSPLPLGMINRFKPFLISGLISEQSMNCKQKDGMEQSIMKEASLQDKRIFGLETVQYQAGLFDSIPYKDQAKELMKYVDSIDTYQKSTAEMIDVYRKQDLERMDSLVRKSDPGMEAYMDLLLYNRNRRWVRQIPTAMREGTLLIAVGAGHLPGEQGVINLLRKSGYTVKPIVN